MSGGYTPLFDTALDGTLFGRWPHTGIWTCLLSQKDRNGEIDMHPNLLAAKIGVPVDTLMACIDDFMKPDPGSRTKDHDGRRLELIDPASRNWGWRVLNHAKYRDKARLKEKNEREVETGRNKQRMGDRQLTADHRRSPPITAADRPSETDTYTKPETDTCEGAHTSTAAFSQIELTEQQHHESFEKLSAEYPKHCGRQNPIQVEQACRRILERDGVGWPVLLAGVRRYAAFVAAGGASAPKFVISPLKFFTAPDQLWLQEWVPPKSKATERLEANVGAAAEAKRQLLEEEARNAGR